MKLTVLALSYDHIEDDPRKLTLDQLLGSEFECKIEIYSLEHFIEAFNGEFLSDQNHFWLVDRDAGTILAGGNNES